MSIYKSTLNNSNPEKEKHKKVKADKIKIKQPKVISKSRYALIVLMVVSAIIFVALCCPSNFIKNCLLGLVGISSYPICLLSIFVCGMNLGKTKYDINRKYVVFLSFTLFFVLMLLHLILTTKMPLTSYVQYLKDTYALKTSGAGLIMSIFTYPMKKYLTTVGAYILTAILVTVFIGLIVDARQPKEKKAEEKPVEKSKFDFGGLISEDKQEETPITLQYKQEDLKKQIARQKLGLESGNSTIISSSMRVENLGDTPKKFRSKKEYILTPPDIVLPDYDTPKTEEPPVASQSNSNNIEQKPTYNSNIFADMEKTSHSENSQNDIFVSDASEFYKDAKIIEAREHTDDNKIQEIKPKEENLTLLKEDVKEEQSLINSTIHNNLDDWLNEEKIESDEEDQPYYEEQEIEADTNLTENPEQIEQEVSHTEQSYTRPTTTQEIKHEEIKFASPNTFTVIHSNTFTTQNNNVFTKEVVEEKKEDENALGRPKKYHPEYVKPPTNLLEYIENVDIVTDEECTENIDRLEGVLQDFKINAKVKAVQVGPAVTRYEIGMPQGVSVKKVQFHADDIAMALASNGSIRIEAPIPGKNAVGIEVPNRNITAVSLREMVESLDFQKRINPMSFVLGKDINGSIQFCNLDKMPHLLVAGSTGSGKSVCLNTMLISMLYKSSPEDVRLILIDPKTVEFSTYANLPHLLTPEIITTKEQTINALNWAIKEMEYRYSLLQRNQVVNIKEYNALDIVKNNEVEKLPYIVIVIDELGDLMIDAKRDMEERIMKLAQKSRAAGIHLVIATQRPSVDVITGTIKANLPSRIAFALTNFADSKTVLDMGGAEKLLGKGDMLFKPSDLPEPRRVQGAYISSKEVANVVKFIKENNKADFDEGAQKDINQSAEVQGQSIDGTQVNFDPVLKDALRFFIQANQASITMIQRRFGVGYARAARIIDQMEQSGFISVADGSKPRQVLISLEEFNLLFNNQG